ncbi:MAG TPA: oligosaccharide flippase family protein [Tepidisphaeraceae bacterium]|jgi:O-antigen/teichoic acid export membrane protein|nr:oligosaccharide flippase family protein [Tepidisphaeraceae bacterium]
MTDSSPTTQFGFTRKSWLRAAREGGWVLTGQIAVAVTGLIGIRLITELAPKEVFGEAALILGILTLCRNFFVSPIANAQLRFHPDYAHLGRGKWFMARISTLIWNGTLLMTLIGAVVYFVWRGVTGAPIDPTLLLVLAFSVVVETARSIRQNRLSAERRQSAAALWSSVESILVIVASIVALKLSPTVESYFIGMVAGSAVAFVIFGVVFHPKIAEDKQTRGEETAREFRTRVIRYGAAFVMMAVLGWILNVSDRYILAKFRDVAVVGVYAAAYGLASRPFLMVASFSAGFVRPVIFQAESVGDTARAKRVFRLSILFTTGVCVAGVIAISLLGKIIARVLLAPAYRADAPAIFVWVGAAYTFYAITTLFEIRLMALRTPGKLVVPIAVAAVSNACLNIYFIPHFGTVGAAATSAMAFFLQLATIAAVSRSRQHTASPPVSLTIAHRSSR